MNPNTLPSERFAVVGIIDPDAYTANTYYTDYIALGKFRRFAAIVMAGDIGSADGTINSKVIAYTDGSGGGGKDVTSAAITALTSVGTDSNKQAIINIDADKLVSLTPGTNYTHFRVTLTTAAQTSDAGVIVLGFDPRQLPASDNDLASVDEIVNA